MKISAKAVGIGQTDLIGHIVFLSINTIYYFLIIYYIKSNIEFLNNIGNTSARLARKYDLNEGLISRSTNRKISTIKINRMKFLVVIEWIGIIFYFLFWYLILRNALNFYEVQSLKLEIVIIFTSVFGILTAGLTLMPITALTVEQGISSFQRLIN